MTLCIKLQNLITKIFLYYPRANELKRFFDIIRAIGTILATMLDIAPYTFDQTFQKKKTFSLTRLIVITDSRNKDVKSFNLTKQFYDKSQTPQLLFSNVFSENYVTGDAFVRVESPVVSN